MAPAVRAIGQRLRDGQELVTGYELHAARRAGDFDRLPAARWSSGGTAQGRFQTARKELMAPFVVHHMRKEAMQSCAGPTQ